MLCYHNFAVAVLFARHARLASGKHVVLQLQVRRETAPDGGTVAGLRCCRNEGLPPVCNVIFFVLTPRLSVRFCRCGCRFNKRRTSSVAISCLVASCCLLKSTFTLLVMPKGINPARVTLLLFFYLFSRPIWVRNPSGSCEWTAKLFTQSLTCFWMVVHGTRANGTIKMTKK